MLTGAEEIAVMRAHKRARPSRVLKPGAVL
jgi:hypothetical protein